MLGFWAIAESPLGTSQSEQSSTIDLVITEQADSITTSLGNLIITVVNSNEIGDSSSSAVEIKLSVASSLSEQADNLTGAILVPVGVSASNTEASDTISSVVITVSGSANISATLSESPDSGASNSVVSIQILSSSTEDNDSISSSVQTEVGAILISVNNTESADSISTTANISVVLSTSLTESSDYSWQVVTYILDRSGVMLNADTGEHEFVHAPSASLDYGFDWTSWLAAGETIVTSDWVVESPLTKSLEQTVDGVTSLFVTGGVIGKIYKVANTITTSLTRTDTRTIKLSCKAR